MLKCMVTPIAFSLILNLIYIYHKHAEVHVHAVTIDVTILYKLQFRYLLIQSLHSIAIGYESMCAGVFFSYCA